MKFFRFLYVNFFALLLMALGVVIFFVSQELFYIIFKIMLSVWCVAGGFALITQWKAKKRKIELLVARNMKQIRPDTFRTISKTLCGQQMVGMALSDLKKTENYRNLSKDEWNLIEKNVYGKTVVDGIFKIKPFKTERR